MVMSLRYNVMFTNDENPYLIDTKVYVFHVECHGGSVATDLVVR